MDTLNLARLGSKQMGRRLTSLDGSLFFLGMEVSSNFFHILGKAPHIEV